MIGSKSTNTPASGRGPSAVFSTIVPVTDREPGAGGASASGETGTLALDTGLRVLLKVRFDGDHRCGALLQVPRPSTPAVEPLHPPGGRAVERLRSRRWWWGRAPTCTSSRTTIPGPRHSPIRRQAGASLAPASRRRRPTAYQGPGRGCGRRRISSRSWQVLAPPAAWSESLAARCRDQCQHGRETESGSSSHDAPALNEYGTTGVGAAHRFLRIF